MLFLSMQCFLLLFLSFIGCVLRCSQLIKVSYFWSWENYKLYKSVLLMQNKSQPYASNFSCLNVHLVEKVLICFCFCFSIWTYPTCKFFFDQIKNGKICAFRVRYLNKKIYLLNTDFYTKFAEVLSTLCQIHFLSTFISKKY